MMSHFSIRPWHIIFLLTIIGGFLRFYNLEGTLQFLGDQGRDALIVRRLLIDHDPVFIGPVTSVGNMYLGPAYYYFMLPFYALSYPSPMGPVYAIAFIGTLTIPLLYLVGRELLNEKAAVFAAILYTFTWTVIENTRFSWNPNPAPFVSLIMIWATYRAWKVHPKYWILVSAMFSILIQLHYLTLLSLAGAGIIWLISLFQQYKLPVKKRNLKSIFFYTGVSIIVFLLSLTPLILFDLKHEFLNSRAFQELLFGQNDQVRGARSLFAILRETEGRAFHILFETMGNTTRWINSLLLTTVVIGLIVLNSTKHFREKYKGIGVLTAWLITGILGASLYRSSLFDHYIAYLFPITALILGLLISALWKTWIEKPFALVILAGFITINIQQYHYQSLGWTIKDMKTVTDAILARVEPGEKYNIVLLSEHGDIDGMNYRYFLTVSQTPPLSQDKFGETETLFVINEDRKIERVVDSPIYEIVVFPDKQPKEIFEIPNGPEITVLSKQE